MSGEREWAAPLCARLHEALASRPTMGRSVTVSDQKRLVYAHEILRYSGGLPRDRTTSAYATDILIADVDSDDCWIPRVVVETKLGRITTHDALTYSAKASTHKNVHPHLRYGILIGGFGDYSLPARLVRHGAHFDFMMRWNDERPSDYEWASLVRVVEDEVTASRQMQELLGSSRKASKRNYLLVHRPLRIE